MSVDEEASHHPVYAITMLSTCVVAVALNILVIAVIGKVGRFRTSVEIFLTNLAASDILQAGVVMPIHFKNLSVQEEDFYGGMSKLVAPRKKEVGGGHVIYRQRSLIRASAVCLQNL